MELFEQVYSSFDTVFINNETQVVRFESSKGWFTEATLTPEIAYFILRKGMVIVYE